MNIRKGNVPNLLRNFPLGLLVGAVFAFLIAWLLDSDVGDGLKKFYTFLGSAAVSLLAAWMAWNGVQFSISAQRNLDNENRQRALSASRSVLPVVLAAIGEKAQNGFEAALDAAELREQARNEKKKLLAELIISETELSTIKECVEYDDDLASEWLSIILANWQVQHSRLQGKLFDPTRLLNSHDIHSDAVEWLAIDGMIQNLWDFARTGRQPDAILPEERVRISMSSRHFNSAQTDSLNQAVQSQHIYYRATGGLCVDAFRSRLTPFRN